MKNRINLIDEIRGLSIILMVFYHGFYLLGYQFGFEFLAQAQKFFEPLQPPFACLFILISGMSSCFSRSNFKRGARLLLIALGFTAVTCLLLPRFGFEDAAIHFGILHLLSVSMLVFALLRPILQKISEKLGFIIFAVLFFLTYSVQSGSVFGISLPSSIYLNEFTAILGFPPQGYYSADYFPLLPFLFMFLCGTYLGKFVLENELPERFYSGFCPALAAIGKKTLIIYIIHWPIIFILGLIISKF